MTTNKYEYLSKKPGDNYQLYLLDSVDNVLRDKTGTFTYYRKWDKVLQRMFRSNEKQEGYSWECRMSVLHDNKVKVLTLRYPAFKELKVLAESGFNFVTNFFNVSTVQHDKYYDDHVTAGAPVDAATISLLEHNKPLKFLPPMLDRQTPQAQPAKTESQIPW
jgi:hypothetical protein